MRNRLGKTPLWAAFALTLLLLLPATASPANAASKKAPGFYWGGWIGSQLTGSQPPYDMKAVKKFGNLVGSRLSMVEFATTFSDCTGSTCEPTRFPRKEMQKIRAYGAIPFLSWSSGAIPADVRQPSFQLSDVISGRYDAYLSAFAREAKAWGHPFFLRFDWEMNGTWFNWAEAANGNRPGQFVAAWRHVHDIFARVGANKVSWVWCPYSNTKGKLGNLAHFYPGDRYVDWTSLDGYNWGPNGSNPHPWKSFDQLFRSAYNEVTDTIAPGKPMLLAEIASNEGGDHKATFIEEMFDAVVNRYPKIHGLIWFDQRDRDLNWPVENSPAAVRAFRSGLDSADFLGSRFSHLAASPIPVPR